MRYFKSLLLAAAITASMAHAQTATTFTYQGSLSDNGSLASGAYNIDISLWDALAGGNQIGSEIMFNGQPVVDGLFTVELDFGASAFDNTSRWIEISVDGTELSPRQPITRSPYSIQTRGIFVDENNNVGIGTAAPSDLLHVRKQTTTAGLPERMLVIDSHDDPNIFDLTLGSGSGILFKVPYQNDSQIGASIDAVRATNVEVNSTTDLAFSVSQNDQILVEAMRINSIGNVGIGTTNPIFALHIANALPLVTLQDTDSTGVEQAGYISLRDSANSERGWFGYGSQVNDDLTVRNNSGDVVLVSNGNRITLTQTGVGIGTSTPSYPLHVESDGTRAIYAWATASTGSAYGLFGRSSSSNGTGVYGYASAHTGNTLGVYGRSESTSGTGVFGEASTSTGTTYGVRGRSNSTNGRGVFGEANSTTGTNYGVLGLSRSPNGFDFYAGGVGTNYGSTSSRRWKSNIVPISDPLTKLAQLRGVYYDWDEEHGGQHDLGMIAEEVGKVLPEIVNYEENGIDAIGMDYSKMTPLLVEATNALRAEKDAQIESLELQIKVVKDQNALLQARLTHIESMLVQLATE